MAVKALTPLMKEALEMMTQHGRLVRWSGGFWTYPDCPVKYSAVGPSGPYDVPEWNIGVHTLVALMVRGKIVMDKNGGLYAVEARLA